MSVAMLRSGIFPRAVAILGIAGNVFDLGLPSEVPLFSMGVAVLLVGIRGVLIIAWNVFISVKLLRRT